jgi:hypothetical protein
MRQGAADVGSAEASLKEHCRGEPRSAQSVFVSRVIFEMTVCVAT